MCVDLKEGRGNWTISLTENRRDTVGVDILVQVKVCIEYVCAVIL